MTERIQNQPVMDKYERVYQPGGSFSEPSITPDQYDKLMRRLHVLEQKITMIDKMQDSDRQVTEVFDRQAEIMEKLDQISKENGILITTLEVAMQALNMLAARVQKLEVPF